MCGLVGSMNYGKQGIFQQDVNLFKEMLYLDAVRGKDSTGMMYMAKEGYVDWRKLQGLPQDLFVTKSSNEFFSGAIADGMCLFGHNRSATKGSVTTDNAHPFEEGNIVLMHNGTLDNEFSFPEWRHADINVDSQLVARLFDTYGAEDTLGRISGAFTFIWLDSKEKKVKIVRNEERPLYMGYSIKDEKFYFASEGKMLEWVLTRNRIDCDKIWSINTGEIYEFDTDNFDYKQTKVKLNEKFWGMGMGNSWSNKPPVVYGGNKTTPKVVSVVDLPDFSPGDKVIMEVNDYGYLTDSRVIVKGFIQDDEFSGASFVGDESVLALIGDVECFSGEVFKVRRAKRDKNLLWQYTLINAEPCTSVVIPTYECVGCWRDLSKVSGEVITRIAQGKEVRICETCFQKTLAYPATNYHEGYPYN